MNIELGKNWVKKLQGRVELYSFEVGVLENKPHKNPAEFVNGKPQLNSYAGGPVTRIGKGVSPEETGDILKDNSDRLGVDLLREPFKKKDSDIIKFSNAFLKWVCTPQQSIKRVENLLQAIVRNPILRGDYGPNSSATARSKGFNRNLFNTGQMFKAIKAKASRRG